MSRARLGDAGLSLLNTLVTVFGAFITFRIVIDLLGVTTFGLWALTGAALFPLRFADLSINSALLRYLGAASGAGLRGLAFRVVGWAMAINLGAFAIFAAAAWLVGPALVQRTVPVGQWGAAYALMPYLVLAALAQLVAGVFSSAMLGLHRYRRVYLVGIAIALLQIALVYPMVRRFGIEGYALLQAGGFSLQALLFAAMIARVRSTGHGGESSEAFVLRAFLAFAFKLNANTLIATMIEPLGKLLLGRFGSLGLVGVYEVVLRIYAQGRLVVVAPLQPFAIAMVRAQREDRLRLRSTFQMMQLYCFAIVAGLIVSIPLAVLVFRIAIGIADPMLAWVVAAVAVSTAAAIGSMPAYHLSVAQNRVSPILACTIIYIGLLLALGGAAGWAFGGIGVLAAIALSWIVSNAAMARLAARHVEFSTRFSPRAARGRIGELWRAIRRPSAPGI